MWAGWWLVWLGQWNGGIALLRWHPVFLRVQHVCLRWWHVCLRWQPDLLRVCALLGFQVLSAHCAFWLSRLILQLLEAKYRLFCTVCGFCVHRATQLNTKPVPTCWCHLSCQRRVAVATLLIEKKGFVDKYVMISWPIGSVSCLISWHEWKATLRTNCAILLQAKWIFDFRLVVSKGRKPRYRPRFI